MSDFFEGEGTSVDFFEGEGRPEPQREGIGAEVEAFGTGAAQGVTLGHADELTAGVGAIKDYLAGQLGMRGDISFSDAYKSYIKHIRDRDKAIEKKAPTSYLMGEITGGVAPAFVTGGGSTAAHGLGRAALEGAVGGAVTASGMSESEIGSGTHLGEMAVGGTIGAALPAAMRGGAKAAEKVLDSRPAQYVAEKVKGAGEKVAEKTLHALGGVPDQHVERYLQRGDKIDAARGYDELAQDIVDGVDFLKDKVIAGSDVALETIPEESFVNTSTIMQTVGREISDLQAKSVTRASESAIGDLQGIASRFEGLTDVEGNLNSRTLKGIIKQIDADINIAERAGEMVSPINRSKVAIRRKMDEVLKNQFPEYREAMVEVAADAGVLSKASKLFGKRSATVGKVQQLARNPQKKIDEAESLKELGERVGKDYFSEAQDKISQDVFRSDATRGSRNVNLWGALLGGAAGVADLGITGGLGGVATGHLAGAYLDKSGPKLTRAILEKWRKHDGVPGMKALQETAHKITGPFGKILKKAKDSSGGDEAMGAVHYLMWTSDPEYRSLFLDHRKDVVKEEDSRASVPQQGNPKYGTLFEKARDRGGDNAVKATHYILSQTDPAYRQKSWQPGK